MADAIMTNGVTTLKFRAGDLQVPRIPRRPRQRLLTSTDGTTRVIQVAAARERILIANARLFLADQGTYAGLNSLYSFFETTVNYMEKSFAFTDGDGEFYHVRFADEILDFDEVRKDSDFQGSFRLLRDLDPLDLSSMQGWWAAWDMDANGGNLAGWTTGQAVTAAAASDWNDRKALGVTGTQATAAAQPLWRTNQINGRPAVDFDPTGTPDYLSIANLAASLAGADVPMSLYLVGVSDSSTATRVFFSASQAAGDNGRIAYYLFNPSTFNMDIKDNAATLKGVSGGSAGTAPFIWAAITSGTLMNFYVNGTQTLTNGDANVSTTTPDQATFGATRAGGATASPWDGRIGELLIFTAAHTSGQRKKMEQRLSDMWGIALAA